MQERSEISWVSLFSKVLYALLIGLSIILVFKMLLLGYFLANDIYPYDLLLHDVALFGIYLLLFYTYAGLTLVLYGWATALYVRSRGSHFIVPLSVLVPVGVLAHLAVALIGLIAVYDIDTTASPYLTAIKASLLTASGGARSRIALMILGNLAMLLCIAIVVGALYAGKFRDVLEARVLILVALFLVLGATPQGSSIITSFVLRTWGIGGGLPVAIEGKNGIRLDGGLILLSPSTVYFTGRNENSVSAIQRADAERIAIGRQMWTK